MKYFAEFRNINETLYRIEITTKKSGSDVELKLSGKPFTTSIESEDKHLYSSIRCGGATIGLLVNDYIEDLYAGQPKAVKVTLYKINESSRNVEWVGYVVPTCYTQGYDTDLEELDIDCIDGIAVLKDIKYQQKGEKKDIITFADIISYCLNQSECYSNLYISDNVQLNSATSNDSVIEIFRMSESGLFNKKDDITEPDENVAWSCYEVLYQICQYLGYTLITDGDKVIIMDYDAIRKGNNTYFKYALGGTTLNNPVKETLSFNYHIKEGSYSQNGTSIEMTPIYNKVTVVDEFNSLDSEETGGETNITASNDPFFKESWIEGKGIGNWYDTCDTIQEEDEFGNNLTYQITVHRLHAERWVYTVVKFYNNPKYTLYRYSKNSPYSRQERTEDGVGYVLNSRGGTYMKYCHIDLGNDAMWHSSILYTNRNNLSAIPMETRRREWIRLLNSKLANLNYNECIVLMNGNQGTDGHIGISRVQDTYEYKRADITDVTADAYSFREPYMNYPCFEYNDENPAIFGSRNGYIVIKGTVTTHDEWWNPWPMNSGTDNEDLKYKKKQKCVYGMFIWCKFQWGDQFWNGSNWTSTECYFKLFWYKGIPENMGGRGKDTLIWNEHYVKRYFDKNLPILGVEQANFVVGEEGYYINAPSDGNLNGKIKFTMYMPRDIWDLNDKRCDRYWTCVQAIQDFKIESSINTGGSLGDDSALDSDTVYTNITNNGAVNDMDEITFKICTFDNKNASYSLVDYLKNDGNSGFVDTTYNKANYSGEGLPMRQEEHLIYKLVTQYQEPHLIYNCKLKLEEINPKLYGRYTDKTLSNKYFIIDSCEFDYKYNEASIKLIEKV